MLAVYFKDQGGGAFLALLSFMGVALTSIAAHCCPYVSRVRGGGASLALWSFMQVALTSSEVHR